MVPKIDINTALSTELLYCIFDQLKTESDYARCMMVCKKWQAIIAEKFSSKLLSPDSVIRFKPIAWEAVTSECRVESQAFKRNKIVGSTIDKSHVYFMTYNKNKKTYALNRIKHETTTVQSYPFRPNLAIGSSITCLVRHDEHVFCFSDNHLYRFSVGTEGITQLEERTLNRDNADINIRKICIVNSNQVIILPRTPTQWSAASLTEFLIYNFDSQNFVDRVFTIPPLTYDFRFFNQTLLSLHLDCPMGRGQPHFYGSSLHEVVFDAAWNRINGEGNKLSTEVGYKQFTQSTDNTVVIWDSKSYGYIVEKEGANNKVVRLSRSIKGCQGSFKNIAFSGIYHDQLLLAQKGRIIFYDPQTAQSFMQLTHSMSIGKIWKKVREFFCYLPVPEPRRQFLSSEGSALVFYTIGQHQVHINFATKNKTRNYPGN